MAVKIYRTTDLIPIKIGEVCFKLSPLTQAQKTEMMTCYDVKQGETVQDMVKATSMVLKFSIKEVSGIEYATGGKYELEFENGALTENCVSELLNLEMKEDLVITCFAFLSGIPTKIKNPATGKEMKGIRILPAEAGSKKKK